MNYPYWGRAIVMRTANGWIVSPWNGPHELAAHADQHVFGDHNWDACQDFIKAVTTERPAGSATAEQAK